MFYSSENKDDYNRGRHKIMRLYEYVDDILTGPERQSNANQYDCQFMRVITSTSFIYVFTDLL